MDDHGINSAATVCAALFAANGPLHAESNDDPCELVPELGYAATGVLGLLLILRLFCLARDYGRDRRATNDQFITQHPQAAPFYQPPTVPVQVALLLCPLASCIVFTKCRMHVVARNGAALHQALLADLHRECGSLLCSLSTSFRRRSWAHARRTPALLSRRPSTPPRRAGTAAGRCRRSAAAWLIASVAPLAGEQGTLARAAHRGR